MDFCWQMFFVSVCSDWQLKMTFCCQVTHPRSIISTRLQRRSRYLQFIFCLKWWMMRLQKGLPGVLFNTFDVIYLLLCFRKDIRGWKCPHNDLMWKMKRWLLQWYRATHLSNFGEGISRWWVSICQKNRPEFLCLLH